MELKTTDIKEAKPPVPKPDDRIYVKIPATDLFDQPHPGVRLNRQKFEAGKTYSVPAEVGMEVERRLDMFNVEQVRLLRPNADRRSIGEVNKGGNWIARGGGNVSALDGGLASVGSADEKVYTITEI